MSAHRPARRPALAAALAVLGTVAALLLGGAPVAAQQDPYGSTTTTTVPPPDPACELVEAEVEVGGTATGEVTGVPPGELLQVTFGGQVLAEVEADAEGRAQFSVVVPDPGSAAEVLVVVGATVNVECDLDVIDVQAGGIDRPPGGGDGPGEDPGSGVAGGAGSTGSGSGSGGGVLARTGENLPLLVGVGLVLLGVGFVLARRHRPRTA